MCENQNQSWLNMLDSTNSSFEDTKNEDTVEEKPKNRDIAIEILDSENEKKYDKLVSEKKIKSPFKRRLSNEKLCTDDSADDRNEKTEKKMRQDHGMDRKIVRNKRKNNSNKKFRSDSTSASDSSSTYSSNCNLSSLNQKEFETDQATLDRRQKQIDYGKNTVGYENYIKKVPKDKRTQNHPKTPPRHLKYSRRAWEGLIKAWRKKLHSYDDDAEDQNE